MKSVFVVFEVDDPYVSDGTLAICSSFEKAKELFPQSLWRHVKTDRVPCYPGSTTMTARDTWENLYSLKTRVTDGIDRPSPYVEEITLDQKH